MEIQGCGYIMWCFMIRAGTIPYVLVKKKTKTKGKRVCRRGSLQVGMRGRRLTYAEMGTSPLCSIN